jgi:hypothetical protein
MKKIINGKLYDTDKARYLGGDSYSNSRDFHHWTEELYVKRTGEYFLYGEGGPMTKYAESTGQNTWSGGEKIMPMSMEAAREWAEEHLNADRYAELFGLPDVDAEPVALNLLLDAGIMAQVRAKAAEDGASLTATVAALLKKGLKAD